MSAVDDVYRESLRDWYDERPFLEPESGWVPGAYPVALDEADSAPAEPAVGPLNRTVDGRP